MGSLAMIGLCGLAERGIQLDRDHRMEAKRRRAGFALILLTTVACKKAAPPPPSAKASVSIRDGEVLLEKTSLGAIAPAEFVRFEPLYSKLKENRLDWKERHPGEMFPGLYELSA